MQVALEVGVGGGVRLACRCGRARAGSGTRRGSRAGSRSRPRRRRAAHAVGEARRRAGSCAPRRRRSAPSRASPASPPARARCRPACRRRRPCPRSRPRRRRACAPRRRADSPSAPHGTPPPIALPIVSRSGSRPHAARAPARPGGERVRLVDDQQRPVLACTARAAPRGSRRPAARCPCWSSPARPARTRSRRRAAPRSSASRSLNSTAVVVTRDVHRRADVPGARDRPATVGDRERLVHRAVVAVRVDQHPRPPA